MRPRGTAKSWRDGREEVTRYRYEDHKGELLFWKVRYRLDPAKWNGAEKDFAYSVPVGVCRRIHSGNPCNWQRKWESDNGRRWTASFHPHRPANADRWLYRLPEALEAIRRGETIHWTEGEKDADAIRGAGGAAVSVHQGAAKATLDQARWLLRARKVIVWADKDWLPGPDGVAHPEVGAYDAALRHDLLVRAGYHADRIAIVRARGDDAERPFAKDAADHVARYGLRRWVAVDRAALREVAREYTPAGERKLGYW